MSALINSMRLLVDTVLVLLFFFLIFAIAGVQLFSGSFKQRCINAETGVWDRKTSVTCGGANDCRSGYFCGKTNSNPDYGTTNFDNVFYAFIQIFQTVTMEGWTSIMIGL